VGLVGYKKLDFCEISAGRGKRVKISPSGQRPKLAELVGKTQEARVHN